MPTICDATSRQTSVQSLKGFARWAREEAKDGGRPCLAKGFKWLGKKFGRSCSKKGGWLMHKLSPARLQILALLPWCSARRCFVFLRDGTILNLSRTSTSIWGESVSFHQSRWWKVSHIFYVHPYLGKWSSLTSIFFHWVETTSFGYRSACAWGGCTALDAAFKIHSEAGFLRPPFVVKKPGILNTYAVELGSTWVFQFK